MIYRTLAITTILILYWSCSDINNPINSKEFNIYSKKIDSVLFIIEEGDIIFRGGTDIESDIIREFSLKDKVFSHCGIVTKSDSTLKITHIIGGITNPSGKVLTEKIEDFISYPENESVAIYKLSLDSKEKVRLQNFIDSIKVSMVVFDLKFNLFTKDKLYCTEFLIDAIAYAKHSKSNNLFNPRVYNLKNTKYYFLTNSQSNFVFYPIDMFQQNSLFSEKRRFYFPNYQKK
jgi:hypothetical protein